MLWHPPTLTVRTPQLRTNESRELEPPPHDQLPTLGKHSDLAVLGRAAFRERHETFGILPEDRVRHLYLVGQTGTGKSTLLANLAAADVAAGRAVVLLDPHGDLCQQLLATVPPRRTNDIILFDPSRPNTTICFWRFVSADIADWVFTRCGTKGRRYSHRSHERTTRLNDRAVSRARRTGRLECSRRASLLLLVRDRQAARRPASRVLHRLGSV